MLNGNTKEVLKNLEKVTCRGYQHYDVFRDWLDLMLYALSGQEDKYMEVIGRYKNEGEIGKREIDYLANAFCELMKVMAKTNDEVLGSVYEEWNVQNKYNGQFFTPRQIAKLMAQITDAKGRICDPSCGAGIMLIETAKTMKSEDIDEAVFFGQDLDERCVKMCALNMCFFNLDGYAVQGNTLALEANWGYATIRSCIGGTIRKMTETELAAYKRMNENSFKTKRPEQAALF